MLGNIIFRLRISSCKQDIFCFNSASVTTFFFASWREFRTHSLCFRTCCPTGQLTLLTRIGFWPLGKGRHPLMNFNDAIGIKSESAAIFQLFMQAPFLNLHKSNHRPFGFLFLNNRENMNLISWNKSHVLCATTHGH
jgi:hypothetical protein